MSRLFTFTGVPARRLPGQAQQADNIPAASELVDQTFPDVAVAVHDLADLNRFADALEVLELWAETNPASASTTIRDTGETVFTSTDHPAVAITVPTHVRITQLARTSGAQSAVTRTVAVAVRRLTSDPSACLPGRSQGSTTLRQWSRPILSAVMESVLNGENPPAS